MTEEHITSQPPAAGPPARDAEWHFIHAGNEHGPMSLAELVDKAVAGQIAGDDLAKKTGGLWTKAREFDFLQQPFLLQELRAKTLNQIGRFHGIWISKKVLVIGSSLLAAFIGFAIVWAIIKPTDPSDALFYYNRGMAWLRKSDLDKAIRDFDEAIRLNPNDARAFQGRGSALRSGNFDQAIWNFDEAIRLNPNDASAFIIRGDAWSTRDHNKALRDYDIAIRLDPKDAGAFCARGEFFLLRKRDFNKAIRDFDEAIRLDAKCDAAFEGRGLVWLDVGDYNKAIRDFEEAIRLNPKNRMAIQFRDSAWERKTKDGSK